MHDASIHPPFLPSFHPSYVNALVASGRRWQVAEAFNALGLTYVIVATKVDKLTDTERIRSTDTIREAFHLPPEQPLEFSSVAVEGLKPFWDVISAVIHMHAEETAALAPGQGQGQGSYEDENEGENGFETDFEADLMQGRRVRDVKREGDDFDEEEEDEYDLQYDLTGGPANPDSDNFFDPADFYDDEYELDEQDEADR